MEENGSSMNFMTEVREVYGRTLAFSEVEGSMTQLKQSLHNGFEIWWLAGMPVLIVFACMLLSLVLVSSTINSTNNTRKWNLQVTSLFSNNKRRKYNKHHATSVNPSTNSATTPVLPTNLKIPKHIAVIMDGNRRYGKAKYGSGTRGHTDGSRTLVNFTQWCMEMGIQELTVFAFSTENWNRDQTEVDALMGIFNKFMHQIVPEALKNDIRLRVLVSDGRKLPLHIVQSIENIEQQTKDCSSFSLNICVSYGSRDEIVRACKTIAREVCDGKMDVDDINEDFFGSKLLTSGLSDPEILLRTSGEIRISNFLLYQIAYSELIFVDKMWPEMTKQDLQNVLLEFNQRKRRFGK